MYRVYVSCDSERAQQYRRENGVFEEAMGLVIQSEVPYGRKGYSNSTRPYTHGLLDIAIDDCGEKTTYPYPRQKVFEETLSGGKDSHSYLQNLHIQMDLIFSSNDDALHDVYEYTVPLLYILEQYYQHKVQVEFMCQGRGKAFHMLQVRPLPSKMFSQRMIEFPEEKAHIAELDAFGCCDEVLEVLHDRDVSKQRGISIITSSSGATTDPALRDRWLPKQGVVLFLQNQDDPGRGHLETLALEKGLVVVSVNDDRQAVAPIQDLIGLRAKAVGGSDGAMKFRVVANGERARFYEVGE